MDYIKNLIPEKKKGEIKLGTWKEIPWLVWSSAIPIADYYKQDSDLQDKLQEMTEFKSLTMVQINRII